MPITISPLRPPKLPCITEWTDEIQLPLLEAMDLPELRQAARSCQHWRQLASDNQVWRNIAGKIHCPLEEKTYEKGEVRPRVVTFIEDLKKPLHFPPAGRMYQTTEIESFITELDELYNTSTQELRKKLSITHINTIQKYLKAIDTLKVQKGLAEAIGIPFNPKRDSIGDVLENANNFNGWFNSNLPELKNITRLSFSCFGLTSIPSEICELDNVTDIVLIGNRFNSLPQEITKLKILQKLSLTMNQFSSLPAIGKLKALTDLDCRENNFTNFPDEIGELTALTFLNFDRNKLSSFPSLKNLKKLKVLTCAQNQLNSFPPDIDKLPKLERLYIGDNKISSLPSGLDIPTSLHIFTIENNNITSIPTAIFKRIPQLCFDGNPLNLTSRIQYYFWKNKEKLPNIFAQGIGRLGAGMLAITLANRLGMSQGYYGYLATCAIMRFAFRGYGKVLGCEKMKNVTIMTRIVDTLLALGGVELILSEMQNCASSSTGIFSTIKCALSVSPTTLSSPFTRWFS